MPKTIRKELSKLTKIIHPKSRKMMKLSKQSSRISNREKTKLVHNMKQNMLGEKLLWFRDHLIPDVTKYTAEQSKELIETYLKRFEDELEQIALKHSVGDRKNRQHANREDIIKLTVLQEEEAFATSGFEVPDLMNSVQLEVLRNWNGELRFLQNFKLQRYNKKNLEKAAQRFDHVISKEQQSSESKLFVEKKSSKEDKNANEQIKVTDAMDVDSTA